MLDSTARRLLQGPLGRAAGVLDRPHVTPDRLTIAGLALGLVGAGAAAGGLWAPALALWLLSRAADGLDGPLARRRRTALHSENAAQRGVPPSEAGGFLDIAADFTVYGAFVVGVGVGVSTEGASLLPFLLVMLTYYVNGSTFLAFSSIAERTGHHIDDGRSLSFLGGLAEGTETVLVHTAWCLVPFWAEQIAWAWAAVVALSATQRIITGYRLLRRPAASGRP
ncbi:CDP-alcohol phosphatidyltransferase family protein [Quadrisphaera oryzae]|uniref:CDP-alcohol phosphatidyltransferase family protein n=1 Tax=Quadrisphaera TaxID=317661 RepID=UPI001644948B|nr:CDP-alcohol phosphatidyltransferase family protein [Quadrisphaera sp. RL12-1S]MBC3763572.1 CDP-alcohol phosphatidyltransferase family protein [Quadrisphaera sp. RL12-1S]